MGNMPIGLFANGKKTLVCPVEDMHRRGSVYESTDGKRWLFVARFADYAEAGIARASYAKLAARQCVTV